MANLTTLVATMRAAKQGENVRDAIADTLEAVNVDNIAIIQKQAQHDTKFTELTQGEANALASADAAADSEVIAADKAGIATTKAAEAAAAKLAAENARTAAELAQAEADAAKIAAELAEAYAEDSKIDSKASETAAEASKVAAAGSAGVATTKAGESAASAADALAAKNLAEAAKTQTQAYKDATIAAVGQSTNMAEIIEARKGNVTIGEKISEIDSQLAENVQQTTNKIAGIYVSKNRFNKNDKNVKLATAISDLGIEYASTAVFSTGYIKTVSNDKIYPSIDGVLSTNVYRIACYDANKIFISTSADWPAMPYTVPSGCTHVRLVVDMTELNILQVELNAISPFVPYEIEIASLGKNLYNSTDVDLKLGYALSDVGVLYVSSTVFTTGYIFAQFGNILFPSNNGALSTDVFSVACYDANKAFISRTSDWPPMPYAIPSGTVYVRLTIANSSLNNLQIELNALTPFETFGKKSNSNYLLQNVSKRELILPSTIVALQGRDFVIYNDNIIYHGDSSRIAITTEDRGYFYCSKEFLKLLPSLAAGNYTLNIVACETYSKYVSDMSLNDFNKICKLKIIETNVGSGVNKKCLFIGDSMTAAGSYTQELLNLFSNDVMKITLLGTKGTAPNLHEGRSGWRAYDYTTRSTGAYGDLGTNAFWNPSTSRFDFGYYMTQQGYTSVDNVFINLGTNDVSRLDHCDDVSIITAWKEMITSIKLFNPDIKIFLWMLPNPSEIQYNQPKKDKFLRMSRLLTFNFDNQQSNNIYLVPVYLNMDTLSDWTYTEVAINSRNPLLTFKQSLDDIHPATTGYNKIADVIYSYIKCYI